MPAGLLLLICVALLSPLNARHQEKTEQHAYDVTVNAITLSVTVQDRNAQYINNLEEKDFTIYENNKKTKITYFKHDQNAPLSITVLLDVSGSMALENKFEECKLVLAYLAEKLLSPDDEIALLVFADGGVEVAASHSTDRSHFLKKLAEEKAYGKTALNDAVAVSPEYATRTRQEKRALLLITDGIENDSLIGPEKALEIARRADVPIYVIGYKIPRNEMMLAKYKKGTDITSAGIVETLSRFALATGGKAFFAGEPSELIAAITEIKKEQSHQYIIGFTSYKEDTSYRQIRVVTSNSKLKVRARQGYY